MKELILDVRPLSFNYPALVYNSTTGRTEYAGPLSTDSSKIANFILEQNIDHVLIYGNQKYTQKTKERLEKELKTQFNNYSTVSPIEVELKGVMK